MKYGTLVQKSDKTLYQTQKIYQIEIKYENEQGLIKVRSINDVKLKYETLVPKNKIKLLIELKNEQNK